MKKTIGVVSVILVMALAIVGVYGLKHRDKIFSEELSKEEVEYLVDIGFVQDEDNPSIWRTKEATYWDRYQVTAVFNARKNRAEITEYDPATGKTTNETCKFMGSWFLIVDD